VIELSKVIAELRRELQVAMDEGQGEQLRFSLEAIELETSIVLGAEGTTGGKVRFWVVDADVTGKASRTTATRLKISLQPVSLPDPEDSTNTEQVLISGQELPSER
jgi:hypothetical protein